MPQCVSFTVGESVTEPDTELTAENISGPSEATTGEPVVFTFQICSNGGLSNEAYKIRTGAEVVKEESVEIDDTCFQGSAVLEFPESGSYSISVEYGNDSASTSVNITGEDVDGPGGGAETPGDGSDNTQNGGGTTLDKIIDTARENPKLAAAATGSAIVGLSFIGGR